jgi:hypothetical protein
MPHSYPPNFLAVLNDLAELEVALDVLKAIFEVDIDVHIPIGEPCTLHFGN